MQHRKKVILALVLLTPVFVGLGTPPAWAKQEITDEAGRVIYTIDDDGMVSMFESSPGIDITLSVTRGTREQMQPQITGVIPASVAAGTSHMLKLKGKNLVGSTVKVSLSGIETGPYAGKTTSIEIPIRVAPNVAPGEVLIHVETPIGSTTASLRITEMQIGSSSNAPSRRESERRQTIPTAAPSSCPEGMIGVAADSGGFCIELDRSLSGDIRKAEKACAQGGKRLCQANEWQRACEQARNGRISIKNMGGDWEWTGSYAKFDVQVQTADLSDDLKSVLLGKTDCQTPYLYSSWRSGPFSGRCCK